MRWNTLGNRELHPIHWVWLWAPAALLLLVIGLAMGLEWLEKKKQQAIGPSEHWRSWIAWYPVRIEKGKTAWLEWVERRLIHGWREHRSLTAGKAGET